MYAGVRIVEAVLPVGEKEHQIADHLMTPGDVL